MEGELNVAKRRKCQNRISLALYILAWMIMILLLIWATIQGNLQRLYVVTDDYGNICGQDVTINNTNLKDKKLLFSMNYADLMNSKWICVEACPDRKLENRQEFAEYSQEHNVHFCDYGVPLEEYANESRHPSGSHGPCPVTPLYKSKVQNNRCFPIWSPKETQLNKSIAFSHSDYNTGYAAKDIGNAYHVIIVMAIFSIALYLIFIWILPYLNICMIKVMMNLLSLTFFILCMMSIVKYVQTKETPKLAGNSTVTIQTARRDDMLATAIIFAILTIISIAFTYFLWTRLKFINAVFKQSRSALFSMPTMLLLPVLNGFCMLLLSTLFIYAILATASVAMMEADKSRIHGAFTNTVNVLGLNVPIGLVILYYVVLYIWTAEFLCGLQHFAIAYPVATRFFDKDRPRNISAAFRGMKIAIKYHMGTITMAASLNMVLNVLRTLIRSSETRQRGTLGIFLCCLKFMLSQMAWLVHAATNPALSLVAIEATSYCQSLTKAAKLLAANIIRFASVYATFNVYMCIGKVVISLTAAILASIWLKPNENLHNYVVPCFVVFVISFAIGHVFFNVFQSVITTMAICYCLVETQAPGQRLNYFTEEEVAMYEEMKQEPAADSSIAEVSLKKDKSTPSKEEAKDAPGNLQKGLAVEGKFNPESPPEAKPPQA